MDSFTVIPGLESQVTSPLLSVQGETYDCRYGCGPPAGKFEDPRSRGLGRGTFGDPPSEIDSKVILMGREIVKLL